MFSQFDKQPSLSGSILSLKPLSENDFEGLFACGGDRRVWAGHPSVERYKRENFELWFADALKSGGSLTIVDKANNQIIGSSRYYFEGTPKGAVAIGYTFLAYRCWGGLFNAELKKLMLEYAFAAFETAYFHIAPSNVRSQKAIEKIGATYVGEKSLLLSEKEQIWRVYSINKNSVHFVD